MAKNVEIDSSFLKNSRTVTYSEDRRTEHIAWDCTPGRVYYNYKEYADDSKTNIYSWAKQHKGYYTGDGIYVYSDGKYTHKDKRKGITEGVFLVKKQYQINNGAWTTIENKYGITGDDALIKLSRTKNGDTIKVKCTYEVWTMGTPYRWAPFMWFGTTTGAYDYGYSSSRKCYCYRSKFSSSEPANPGRVWSGMRNYEKNSNGGNDKNAAWELISRQWYQPYTSTSTTNWTYLHAKDPNDVCYWSNTYKCEIYKHGTPITSKYGWTTTEGVRPQPARKNLFWRYTRTIEDTITTRGISEKPAELKNPTVAIKVYNNLTTPIALDNQSSVTNGTSNLDGTCGTIEVTYNQSDNVDGKVTIYACQLVDGSTTNYKKTLVVSDYAMNANTKANIEIDFIDAGLQRSKEIRYYAVASVFDEEYNVTRTGTTCTALAYNNFAASHYFNDEPKAPNAMLAESPDHTKQVKIMFNRAVDPDRHELFYDLYVYDKDKETVGQNELIYNFNFNNSTTSTSQKFSEALLESPNNILHTTRADGRLEYTVNTSKYDFGHTLKIWLVPHDKYRNNYYYASEPIEILLDKDPNVTLEVINNRSVQDSDGKLYGEHGYVTLKYKNKKGKAAKVDIYVYQSNGKDTDAGVYKTKIMTIDNVQSGSNNTYRIDFNGKGLTRSRYLKYFAVATDTGGVVSRIPLQIDNKDMWDYAVGYHYYNEAPSAITPYLADTSITEGGATTEYAKLCWGTAVDPDDDTVTYYLYVRDESKLINSGTFYWKDAAYKEERYGYTDVYTISASKLPSNEKPYELYVGKYSKNVTVWITTKDNFNNSYYLSGDKINFANPGVNPYEPILEVANDYHTDGRIRGEYGKVRARYSHPTNRAAAIIKLYGMAKYDNGTIRILGDSRNGNVIAKWTSVPSGSTTNFVTLDFRKVIGSAEVDRCCEVKYYAVAEIANGNASVDSNWRPNTRDYNDWYGANRFNDEPPKPVITLDESATDRHRQLAVRWNKVDDPDGDNVWYTVVLAVENELTSQETFFYGLNRQDDRILKYTDKWETTNNFLTIDLKGYDDNTEVSVWVVPHDNYYNSYYFTSNTVTVAKAGYNRPQTHIDVTETHGEHGMLKVSYTHPDVNDQDRTPESLVGNIVLHCYIEGNHTSNYYESFTLNPGESKDFDIDFSKICGERRSVNISYYAIVTDTDPGTSNTDADPMIIPVTEQTFGHYYNDEPDNPIIKVGPCTVEADKFIYGFNYVNLTWQDLVDPDEDPISYYVYMHTPNSMNELPIKKVTINDRYKMAHEITYNRLYKVVPFVEDGITRCTVYRYNEALADPWIKLYDKQSLGFTIDYEAENFPIDEEFNIWVEARDEYENSYYGISNTFVQKRYKHKPPAEVEIEVLIDKNKSQGIGEYGYIILKYTHPEGAIPATITLHAYQGGEYKGIIDDSIRAEFEAKDDKYCFITYKVQFTDYDFLVRSKDVSYYAVAVDDVTGTSSYKGDVKTIPYVSAEEAATFKGSKQATGHYYNEEPPGTTPEPFDSEAVAYKDYSIKWNHVVDPDGDDVKYVIYVTSPNDAENTLSKEFYNDQIPDKIENYGKEDSEVNAKQYACGTLYYNKAIEIEASLAEQSSKEFNIVMNEYGEDGVIDIWIESKDEYENSYYRTGEILQIQKGHKARDIQAIYPKNGSVVYNTQPRILIFLGKDTQKQTVYVSWGEKTYNNVQDAECFSSTRGVHDAIVFKPPVPYTNKHNSKVSYAVWANNGCTSSEKKYSTYTYRNFFNDLSTDYFIGLKSAHVNLFREATQDIRDAYGLLSYDYSNQIQKNAIMTNEDFNESKDSICAVNDKINNADPTEATDIYNPLIVNLNDLDIVELGGYIIGDMQTDKEFVEWARLVYLIENM